VLDLFSDSPSRSSPLGTFFFLTPTSPRSTSSDPLAESRSDPFSFRASACWSFSASAALIFKLGISLGLALLTMTSDAVSPFLSPVLYL